MFCTRRPVKFLALVVTFVSTYSFAQTFYEPTERGFEARLRERLDFWAEQRESRETKPSQPI